MPLIVADSVTKELGGGEMGLLTTVLDNVSMSIDEGEFVAITGPSGSGKSTLLYLLGLLDRPTSGVVSFDGASIEKLEDRDLARIRNRKIGFIYQFHFLLPEFSALENVVIPMRAGTGMSLKQAEERAAAILGSMDMGGHLKKRPNQLSGGQQQRVAIARAMANSPKAIFGDEPTGNLDSKNSAAIFDLFEKLNRETNQTLVVVTHDRELAKRAHRVVTVRDGKIEDRD